MSPIINLCWGTEATGLSDATISKSGFGQFVLRLFDYASWSELLLARVLIFVIFVCGLLHIARKLLRNGPREW